MNSASRKIHAKHMVLFNFVNFCVKAGIMFLFVSEFESEIYLSCHFVLNFRKDMT